MPFQIKKQDISRFVCDAVVNPTDRLYSGSGGTDYAIHTAAGEELDKECETLTLLNTGETAVTRGYRLPCRWVIHTVGPVWKDGSQNEEALLRSCYLNALFQAAKLGAESVAFPLISSGTFGFPKDRVLKIAVTAISDFLNLTATEMNITICLFDPEAYELREQAALAAFLREKSVSETAEWFSAPNALKRAKRYADIPASEAILMPMEANAAAISEDADVEAEIETDAEADAPEDLSEWMQNQDDSFAVMLLKLIDRKEMTDVQCYKKANVSKNTFWKINNDPKYRPSKATVLAFAIALELTLAETEELLRTVGFSLSHSNKFDLIIEFFIRRGNYDIFEINAALFRYDQICLGC